MDKIIIKDLEIYAYHGVLEDEKKQGQNFIITAELLVDLRPAGLNDDLERTVNYAQVCGDIKEVMTSLSYDLIEAAAEHVADMLLKKYDGITQVNILLKKPHAPIDMTFDCMSVYIERKWHKIYLGIGSNMGDKKGYLDYAVEQLKTDSNIRAVKASSYIVTEPYGDVPQDDFLNGCVEAETLYTPDELLDAINGIEQAAGRERIIHWGPRTLDIDILLYDREVICTDRLRIPHIEMAKRDFVLRPLCEIAPYAYNAVYNATAMELFERLLSKG